MFALQTSSVCSIRMRKNLGSSSNIYNSPATDRSHITNRTQMDPTQSSGSGSTDRDQLAIENFLRGLKGQRYNFNDFNILCGTDVLKTHRIVLTLNSSWFRAWFREHPDKHSVDLTEELVNVTPLRHMLDFCYDETYDVSANGDRTVTHVEMVKFAKKFVCHHKKQYALSSLNQELKESSNVGTGAQGPQGGPR